MTDENYLKFIGISTILPLVPRPIQKKLLFSLLNDAKIQLSKEELESVEHQYREIPNCISITHIKSLFYGCDSWALSDFQSAMLILNATLKNIEAGKY